MKWGVDWQQEEDYKVWEGFVADVILPGLVAHQCEIAVIQQGRQGVADCCPVLISKRVGAQIDIGPSEGLL